MSPNRWAATGSKSNPANKEGGQPRPSHRPGAVPVLMIPELPVASIAPLASSNFQQRLPAFTDPAAYRVLGTPDLRSEYHIYKSLRYFIRVLQIYYHKLLIFKTAGRSDRTYDLSTMSAHVLANEGIQLVKANKYAEGIEKLSQALKSQPAPMWLLERSKAYMRTNEFGLALHDAERALSIAFKRANRDLMVEAQLRRAIVLFRMNRFADADVCTFWSIQLVEGARASEDDGQQNKVDEKGDYAVTLKEVQDEEAKRSQAKKEEGLSTAMGGGRSKDASNRNLAASWRIQALSQLATLEPGAPGRKVSVVKYPTPSAEPPAANILPAERVTELDDSEPEEEPNKPKIPAHILTGANPPAPAAPATVDANDWTGIWNLFRDVHTKNNSIRTDFYQSDTSINVSFFVKNVPQSEFKGTANSQSVSHLRNCRRAQQLMFCYRSPCALFPTCRLAILP